MVTKSYPPIILGFFARGLNTNRQPLFSALTGVGLQVVQFKDYLVDGINVECSDKFTLQRAPGFVKFCSVQLAVSEKVNQFESTRDIAGNVYPLVDTNQNLYKMTPSSLTSILTKGTTAQGYIQRIGGVTYYANGTDLKKWLPPAASMVPWGVAAPSPILLMTTGSSPCVPGWIASGTFGFQNSLLDANGNIEYQTVNSTVSTNLLTFPSWSQIIGSTVIDGTAIWENVGPTGNWVASNAYVKPTVVTDTNNNLQLVTTAGTSGATVPSWNATFGGTTTDSGVTWTNIGPGSIVAYSGYSYVACFRTVTGNLSTASNSVSTGPLKLSVPVTPIPITAWSITSNVLTLTAANTLQAGTTVLLSGFTGAGAAILNNYGNLVLASGLSSSQFKMAILHANTSGGDAGVATPVVAQIKGNTSSTNPECNATAPITSVQVTNGVVTVTAANNFTSGINIQCSGLSTATFLNNVILQVVSASSTQFTLSLPNQANYGPTGDSGTATFLAVEIYRTQDGGGVYYYCGCTLNSGIWIFYDAQTDSQLTTSIVAPLAHQNDPPPGQTGSTVSTGGTILAWWNNRIWMAVGNKLYFSGGPDTLNGIAEECWPPGNVFVFPGTISALNATTGGLAVTISEEMWAILGGPQTFALYPERVLTHFGALSANCVRQDGDTLYVYSSQKQLTVLSGAGKNELGANGSGVSPVGDLLANGTTTLSVTASAWPATSSYLTIHRQGEDSGIYLSNGVESIIRYGLNVGNFSPVRQPFVTGAAVSGALNSVETSPGQYSLLLGPTTTHDFIYARSLTTFSDNAHAYASNFVVGNIVVTEPGQPLAPLHYITAYLYKVGSVPSVSFYPNDITPSASSPFVPLPLVQAEPVFLKDPVNLISKRWPTMMNQSGAAILIRHLQMKMDFGATDTVKNELIELGLRFENEQLL